MLHTMSDYLLFLLDSLLLRCDTTVGLFYKGLLRSIKSSEDATLKLDQEEKKDASQKFYVLVDLAYVILTQRAPSLMMCRANSNLPLPELYFKKGRYNPVSYLPKDFQIKLKAMNMTKAGSAPKADETTTASNRKRTSEEEENNKEQTSPSKKRKTSVKRRERSQSIPDDDLSSVNGKKSRTTPTRVSNRSRINFSYEKPQLRSSSASSLPARKTRGKLPARLAAKS